MGGSRIMKNTGFSGLKIIIFLLSFLLIASLIGYFPRHYSNSLNNSAQASSFEGEDVLKGVGIAVAVIAAAQLFLGERPGDEADVPEDSLIVEDESTERFEEALSGDRLKEKENVFELIQDDKRKENMKEVIEKKNIDEAEIDMLAHLIHGEARGEPFEGQIAVAGVVLNRKESSQFPDTITGVIYQDEQFTALEDGQFHKTPDRTSYEAVFEALEGEDPSKGAYYFYNPLTADNLDWFRTLEEVNRIGNHIFAVKP